MSKEHPGKPPLPALILQLSRYQAHLYATAFGMSQSRLLFLRELMRTGEISQAELVHLLGMEGTLVTRFVKDMERSGLPVGVTHTIIVLSWSRSRPRARILLDAWPFSATRLKHSFWRD